LACTSPATAQPAPSRWISLNICVTSSPSMA
jgi:hypothetical protein